MSIRGRIGRKCRAKCLGFLLAAFAIGHGWNAKGGVATPGGEISIEVDAAKVTGEVHPFIFGQFIEHEHKTIQGGIWAEMLRDRKFEQGDVDRDGVADDWLPEEFVADHYWELTNGRSATHRYFIDQQEFYGGGASQGIELYGPGSTHTSIFQTGLQVMKGHKYVFYVYLKLRGTGTAWVELGKLGRSPYGSKEFTKLSSCWEKYTAEFISPEDTPEARIRIGVEGRGVFRIDSASLIPADNLGGMRRDVIEALRPLRIPMMRYPGGCFADEFHWTNAIGPRDKRPTTWSDVWQEWDLNDFGIDEFMEFARELGFQALLTSNYASGTPEEAAHWVEYTNGSKEQKWGQERLRNGHPEPYGVKFWAVGNEPAESCRGEYTGGTNVGEYAQRFQQFRSAMRNIDPSVRIIAGGIPPGPVTWNRDLLRLLPEPSDLLAMSLYTGRGGSVLRICDLTEYYQKVVSEPQEFEHMLDEAIAGMGNRFPQDHPAIAVTEYNSWWMPESGDPEYRLCNALYLAGVYNSLFRHANQVAIANWNTTVNVQGVVSVNPTGVKLTPAYFANLLYRNHVGNQVLSTQTTSPTVPFNPQLPTIDAVATLSQDGHTLYLAVINCSEADDMATTVRLKSWTVRVGAEIRVWELNGNNRDAANPYGSAENVNIREKAFSIEQVPFSYRFPAHSVTALEIPGQRGAQ